MDTVSISPRALYSRLATPNAPWLIDVRRREVYDEASDVIVAAVRVDDVLAFAEEHGAGRCLVAYCVHGHELSQGAAAALRAAGHDAAFLEGGIDAWRGEGLPTIRKHSEWHVPGGSRWITRERPKIDRIACPWLIRRFIDPLARFDYVPTKRVFDEAKARDAVPYDIPGAIVTHRGERCSFDALIEDFALSDPALDRLATIVRGADTDRHDLAPQCAGLAATSLGLSRRYADDHEMLANALPVYDGLYAWCRAQQEGDPERHDWKPAA
ncbi:MAG TPA: chromate resistance protein ChrB domain-containing protein [Usitatibacter sp.]|nr:chromate resistance protein ChrB domain-containing protein [Usitatibacter sp.]